LQPSHCMTWRHSGTSRRTTKRCCESSTLHPSHRSRFDGWNSWSPSSRFIAC
jgi:hypothetical protein